MSQTHSCHTPAPGHKVDFLQNTFSGKRVLTVNGSQVFRVSVKYKLTGTVDFDIEGTPAQVVIDARDYGALHYTLIVGGKTINPDGEERIISAWKVDRHTVEFEHTTFNIYVDSILVESGGEFMEEGSKYTFALPDGRPAEVLVTPGGAKDTKVPVRLMVAGTEITEASDDVEAESDRK